VALGRYHQRTLNLEKLSLEQQRRMNATGEEAIALIKETYNNHENLNEAEFIRELLKLAFQA
jgi:hypothetical protein